MTHVEASVALGVKGTVVVWCATAAPAAPYKADKAALQGGNLGVPIPAGQSLDVTPDFMTLQKRQMGQFRFLLSAVPDNAAGALTGVLDDYDVRLSAPAASPRGGTQRAISVINAMFQGHLPGATDAAPAQGANATLTADDTTDPFDKAARTELFLYGPEGGGKVSIANNGSAAAAAGALGLHVGLFLFNLSPIPSVDVTEKWHLGYRIPVPAMVGDLRDVITIPVASQQSPKGTG